MNAFEIALTAQPQRFSVTLNGVLYKLQCYWNTVSLAWVLDILTVDDVPFIMGIPLVTGDNLLGQYEYMGIGGALIVQTDSDLDAVPTFDNLGEAGKLYFVVQ